MAGKNLMSVEERLDMVDETMDQVFLIVMGIFVMMMQTGFAFLEAGSVRSKNATNLLIKNLLDAFVAGIAYWTIGYAFAFGEGNGFIGWHYFASAHLPKTKMAHFFFQYVFAATAATIVSGAVAERCEMVAYFVYSIGITAFIYPVVTHWAWSDKGWLKMGLEYEINNQTVTIGYLDFAGSGVVHCVGGSAAFAGAVILGPRYGRFHKDNKGPLALRGHSIPLTTLGGFILCFGFLAFNGGSRLSISQKDDGAIIGLAVVNTFISGSVAAVMSLIIRRIKIFGGTWSLLYTLNGALAGMVAVCAGCDSFMPWGAVIVGAIAGISFNVTSWFIAKVKIDDPVDAVAVHMGGGVWGVIAVGFLNYDSGILVNADRKSGLLLAWQLVGLCSICAWSGGLSAITFGVLRLLGLFRVPEEMEKKGLDLPKHGEPAYPMESYGHGYIENIPMVTENGDMITANLGHSNGNVVDGKDRGNYESPEVRNIHHIAKPKFGHEPAAPPSYETDKYPGQVNASFYDEVERTAL